jgi:ethanolamine utilization cobalamin adenosyltransferase
MFITESELREKWQSGAVTRFDFPADTRFSPSALDFIKQWKLSVTIGGEPLEQVGHRIHHYSENVAPESLARATQNPREGSGSPL